MLNQYSNGRTKAKVLEGIYTNGQVWKEVDLFGEWSNGRVEYKVVVGHAF